jgi:hypothetical protein
MNVHAGKAWTKACCGVCPSTERAQKAPEFGLVNFVFRIWHVKTLQLVKATKHGLVLVGFSV